MLALTLRRRIPLKQRSRSRRREIWVGLKLLGKSGGGEVGLAVTTAGAISMQWCWRKMELCTATSCLTGNKQSHVYAVYRV